MMTKPAPSLRRSLALATGAAVIPAAIFACHKSGDGNAAPATSADAYPQQSDLQAALAAQSTGAGSTAGPAAPAPLPSGGNSRLVINPATPQPLAPPPLRARPAIPSIPNLPPPDKYPRLAGTPRRADTTECGEVWTGTDYVPLECFDPDARVGNARSAKVVVPYEKMRQPPESLPQIVDHRADGTEGPVRDQTGVPVCTAMALTAALDHAYARWTGQAASFSIMQVWARYHDIEQLETVHSHQMQESVAAEYAIGALLGNEEDWPFDVQEARGLQACSKKPGAKQKICGLTPDKAKVAAIEQKAIARVTQMEVIGMGQSEVLREKLAAGQDVAVAIRIPKTFTTAGEPGSRYWVPGVQDWDGKYKGSHQILLAGYAMTPSGVYYLVHNSFGTKWGDLGFAWLHEDYLRAYASNNYMVIPDVEPIAVERLRLRARGEMTPSCPAGQAPDSISGACVGLCPDGSPRHNNTCATPNSQECPPGMINLTGECMMSAPRSSGTEPSSGVSWACGAAGCAYTIPAGRLECKAASCAISCPAPAFRLAKMPNASLVCVE